MEKLILIILGLVAVGCCAEDPVELFATYEVQNLTSPDLVGITRPKDFRWRIWKNSTRPETAINLHVDYLHILETEDCTGSYLELIPDGESEGRMCESFEVYGFMAYESYFDIILHVGPGTDTPEFHMNYLQAYPTIDPVYPPYKCRGRRFRFWVIWIIAPIVIVTVTIATGCCLRKRCRNRKMSKEMEANMTQKNLPPAVFTGPPSYDDVSKTNHQPPAYTTLA